MRLRVCAQCYMYIIMFILLLPIFVCAQTVNEKEAIAACKKVSDAYRNQNIRFDVVYKYADMAHPAKVLDSIRGRIQLNGDKFYYDIDNMITVHNDECTITLFKDEKLMYLSKPAVRTDGKKMKRKQIKTMDAIFSLMDSIALRTDSLQENKDQDKSIQYQIAVTGKYKMLTIRFPKGAQFKNIDIYIDTVANRIIKSLYIVRSQQMLGIDPGTPLPSNAGVSEYAVVEANYINYSAKSLNTSLFDSQSYFIRAEQKIVPAEAYKAYKIVIGTPNF